MLFISHVCCATAYVRIIFTFLKYQGVMFILYCTHIVCLEALRQHPYCTFAGIFRLDA